MSAIFSPSRLLRGTIFSFMIPRFHKISLSVLLLTRHLNADQLLTCTATITSAISPRDWCIPCRATNVQLHLGLVFLQQC